MKVVLVLTGVAVLGILLFMGSVFAVNAWGFRVAEERYTEGARLLVATPPGRGCSTEAAGLLKLAAAAVPEEPRYRNAYGVSLMRCRHIDVAISEFQAALRADPSFTKAAQNLDLATKYKENRSADSIAEALAN